MTGKQEKLRDTSVSQSDPTYPLQRVSTGSEHRGDKFIGEIKVEPQQQPRISLGYFTRTSRLKGFAIELTPDPDPENSIVAQVVPLGEINRYELMLHIANYGSKVVTAKVWQMS